MSNPDSGQSQKITSVLDELISIQKQNIRMGRPTKFEQVLAYFKDSGKEVITMEELIVIFEGTKDPQQQLRLLISRLNEKLKAYGFIIEHVPAYRLTLTDEFWEDTSS